jgi:hypothetical protein
MKFRQVPLFTLLVSKGGRFVCAHLDLLDQAWPAHVDVVLVATPCGLRFSYTLVSSAYEFTGVTKQEQTNIHIFTKSKAVPLPSRRWRPGEEVYLLLILGLGTRWGWVVSVPRRRGKDHRYPGWASEPVWTQRLQEKFFASAADRTAVIQSVVKHCTDWAIPALPSETQSLTKCYIIRYLLEILAA